jgi:hypothetical protein
VSNESISISVKQPELSEKVDGLIEHCLELPQVQCPVTHHLYPGLYIREVKLPAGCFAIGHYQNKDHVNVFAKGKVTMVADSGEMITLEGPVTFEGKPGRKVGFVHEEVTWLNIYPTTETDVEKLEAEYLTKSETFLRKVDAEMALCGLIEDRADYQNVLAELGVNQEQVDVVVQDESDQVPMPSGSYKFQFAASPIHGKGVYAAGNYAQGEEIGIGRVGGKRTPLGRFMNHSSRPNAGAVFAENGDVYFHALREIRGNNGGMLGEEITLDYRGPLSQIYGTKL